ncbi:VDR-like protein [Mya arenaria]|uniref:VDR-like protein n=1 Tax=Mya arenaria TaxID=6604 RepID=A0ABY7FJ22_MYAAR|nr:VDR-like protein [Mya arenaria]
MMSTGGSREMSDVSEFSGDGPNSSRNEKFPQRKRRLKSERICQTPPCLFQNNCQIDLRTRRFCPHCRLMKCFEIGMKREMILDDGERQARMQKVLENRKRKGKSNDSCPVTIKEEPSESNMLPDQSDSSCMPHSIVELTHADVFPMFFQDNLAVEEPIVDPEFTSKDPQHYRTVSAMEYNLFKSASSIYLETMGELRSDDKIHETDYKNCNDLINNSSEAVKKLVSFCKQMEDFQKVPQKEQLLLLKQCVFSAIIIRSAWFYSIDKDAWNTASGEISAKILKTLVSYNQVYEQHTMFCRKVKTMFSDDPHLFSLVQLLCVFDPMCPNVQNKTAISNLHDKYLLLLRHYLEWKYSFKETPLMFREIVNLLVEIKDVVKVHNMIIVNSDPSQIEPLMLEILDLK